MKTRSVLTVTLNPAIDQTIYIDDFAISKVNRVRDQREDAGGKGVNVAGFLADYGMHVTATGFLGTGNSLIFSQYFSGKGIQDKFFRLKGHTRTGIKIADLKNRTTTNINFPGIGPGSGDMTDLYDLIREVGAGYAWAVLAGSVPEGIPLDCYANLIRDLKNVGVKVALDASGESYRQGLKEIPNLIKPNLAELEEYCGTTLKSKEQVISAGQKLLTEGIETVIVSMGEEGALFLEGEDVIHSIGEKVTVESTSGAGDAMVSGMIAGKIDQKSFADCARLATAFSVLAVTTVGAGIESMSDLHKIEKTIKVMGRN